jgi:RimJ/RimL family protein N-acetyltransferase
VTPIPTLTGPRVRLRPLTADDGPALVRAASDGELWNLRYTSVPSAATVDAYLRTALAAHAAGTALPFAIELIATGEAIGCTRFFEIEPAHRSVEIGYTWIAASWQRSFVNTEAKFLLLRHAFEEMRCLRVQFTTDFINERSRAAIARLGARQEGILRAHRIRADGTIRDSVRFSLIEPEWPEVKARLLSRLARE